VTLSRRFKQTIVVRERVRAQFAHTTQGDIAMYETKNDLLVDIRTRSAALLNQRLADAVDLGTQVKQAHWNVRGASFIALHELFDQVAEHVEDQVDLLAERVTALGGVALGTVEVVSRTSSLRAYPLDIRDGTQHLQALSNVVADFAAKIRAAIDKTAGWGDATTSDVFTQISREVDKDLWLLEAHLDARQVGQGVGEVAVSSAGRASRSGGGAHDH
jgi:starvation-inducible DNA-binding protein